MCLYKSNHSVLAVFVRAGGTNYSTRQRLGCLFMNLVTICVSSAVFYGVKQSTFIGDATASLIISLWSMIPVLIVKQIFVNLMPKSTEQKKQENEDNNDEKTEFRTSTVPKKMHHQKRASISIASFSERPLDEIGFYANTEPIKEEMDAIEEEDSSEKDDELSSGIIKGVDTLYGELDEKGMNTKISTFRKGIDKAQKENIPHQKSNNSLAYSPKIARKVIDGVREKLLHKKHPLKNKWWRVFGWMLLILWSSFCIIMAIGYGIQFDLTYNEVKEGYLLNDDCWKNNKLLVSVETYLSLKQVAEKQSSLHSDYSDDFKTDTSTTWLLSLLESFALSIAIWQPVTIYIVTWLKLWFFSLNLRMTFGRSNLMQFVKTVTNKENHQTIPTDTNLHNKTKTDHESKHHVDFDEDSDEFKDGYGGNKSMKHDYKRVGVPETKETDDDDIYDQELNGNVNRNAMESVFDTVIKYDECNGDLPVLGRHNSEIELPQRC